MFFSPETTVHTDSSSNVSFDATEIIVALNFQAMLLLSFLGGPLRVFAAR